MSAPRFEFTVFGDPKGQPRARAFARNMGGGKFVARVFDSGTAEGWKSLIAAAARDAGVTAVMLEGPLTLRMRCFFVRPKSHFRTGKNAALIRDDAPVFHTAKPDLDNVVKAAKDALTQVGAWKDDCQVVHETLSKRYTDGTAYTVFEIAPMDEEGVCG